MTEKRLLPYHLLAQMGEQPIIKNHTEIIANETAKTICKPLFLWL